MADDTSKPDQHPSTPSGWTSRTTSHPGQLNARGEPVKPGEEPFMTRHERGQKGRRPGPRGA